MPASSRRSISRRAFIALALGLPALYTARKVHQYSAEPSGEQDCLALASHDPVASVPPTPALPWRQRGGTINDASCLSKTPVYGVVQVTEVDHIRSALHFARQHGLKVSIAGVRHSMGGQAFARNAVVLDMTRFNRMWLDPHERLLTVQSGATWHDIQNVLHPRFAVKAMQSTDIFTVGGSISVNAHGMDHRAGAVGKTIRAMRLMLPDGSIRTLSREENRRLFDLVIGGYGLFGIILQATLEITDNVLYASGRRIIAYNEFPALFERELAPDAHLGLMYGHLATAPPSFLGEMILYTYREAAAASADLPPLREVSHVRLRRLLLNISKRGALPRRVKWLAEKYIEPRLEACAVTRNQAMRDGEACLVPRNQPMHDSVPYLRHNLRHETDILQEYFIPRDHFVAFIDGLRRLMTEHRINLLNASVRVVPQEDNVLNYAPGDMFAIVLYINQQTHAAAERHMQQVTRQVIDLALGLRGTFFLPYRLSCTPEQLRRAYPAIAEFFAARQHYDPYLLLTNTLYETFAVRV